MVRRRSGILGKKEAEGSASSTPFLWQGQGKHFIKPNLEESTYVNFPHWFWRRVSGGSLSLDLRRRSRKIVRRNNWSPRKEAVKTWQPFLQPKRCVPWRFSSLFLARYFERKEENVWREYHGEENKENFLEKMKIGRIFSKLVWISDMFIISK